MKTTLLNLADKTVDSLEKDNIKKVARRAWFALLRQKKLSSLDKFIELVEIKGAEKKGELWAQVASARKLSEEELDSVKKSLETKYKTKVTVDTQVDSSILGGIKIKIADEIIDMSWRGKINSLKVKLGV